MKIEDAHICLDCECVFDGHEHDYCPECAGKSSAPLSAWLGAPMRHMEAVRRIGTFNMHDDGEAAG